MVKISCHHHRNLENTLRLNKFLGIYKIVVIFILLILLKKIKFNVYLVCEQLLEVSSLLPLWASGIQFRLSG